MSRYEPLQIYIKENNNIEYKLSFNDIKTILSFDIMDTKLKNIYERKIYFSLSYKLKKKIKLLFAKLQFIEQKNALFLLVQ